MASSTEAPPSADVATASLVLPSPAAADEGAASLVPPPLAAIDEAAASLVPLPPATTDGATPSLVSPPPAATDEVAASLVPPPTAAADEAVASLVHPPPAAAVEAAASLVPNVNELTLAPGSVETNGAVSNGGGAGGEGSSGETLERAAELFEKGLKALEDEDFFEAVDCPSQALDQAQRPLEQDDAEDKGFLDESLVSSPCSVNGQESSLLAFEGVANDRPDISPGIHENEDPVELPKASSKQESPAKESKEDSSMRKSTPSLDPKGTDYHGARRAVNAYQRNQDKKRLQGLFELGKSRQRAEEARRNEEAAREARTVANREHKARRKAVRNARLEADAAAAAPAAAADADDDDDDAAAAAADADDAAAADADDN